MLKARPAEGVAILDDAAAEEVAEPLIGQEAIDRLLQDWLPLWVDDGLCGESHPLSWKAVWSLPDITGDQVMGVIDSFAKGIGLGWDGMHPRLLHELGMPFADRMAAILSAW